MDVCTRASESISTLKTHDIAPVSLQAPYVFLEATNHVPLRTAYLTSAPGQYAGIKFKYHMFGASMGYVALETQSGRDGYWVEVGPLPPPLPL